VNERPKITLPIIVEGRYDKSTVTSIFDATVITTSGFAIFNSREKQCLIRKLAERGGVIVLTDSDAGGVQIRKFLSGILPHDKIYNLYIPQIRGKERRKDSPSKAGYLGVEGMSADILRDLLMPFSESGDRLNEGGRRPVTRLDFYSDGFSGKENSSDMRDKLAISLGLPKNMSAKALLEAINLLFDYEKYESVKKSIE
jgi:ribonuclease M5